MAKKDEKPSEEAVDTVVEDESPVETETNEETEEPQTDDEATDAESTEEESEEQSEELTEEEKAEFEKRFPRFKGETLEEYVKNLEEGYANSYEEFKKVRDERDALKAEGLAKIANEDGEDQPTPPTAVDPALAWAKQKRDEEWRNDWLNFAKIHPEVEQDEIFFQQFDKKVGDMYAFIQQTESREPSLKEAMEKTWAYMNPDSVSNEEKIAMKAKDAAAGTKAKGVTKDLPKPKFSDKQIETAKRFDPELREKSRSEIEEILSKYVK